MKSILSVMKQFFLIGDDTPTPRPPFSTMWMGWIIGVIILFDFAFAEEVLSFSSTTAIFLGAGIIPSIWSFHDVNYVKLKLKKKCNSLLAYLYRVNLIWMAIGEIAKVINQWGEIGIPFVAKESVFLFFWFLSIPLIVVYRPWRWGVGAITIFVGTIGYKLFLEWYLERWGVITFSSVCLIIGVLVIAVVLSIKVSQNKICEMFSERSD